jgi:L-alanine-DL-glutamate epimerase-like enolase superfamily enzyme
MVWCVTADAAGAEGWGEIWCNWPAVGAEHRARLAVDLGERLVGRTLASPDQAFRDLTAELEVMALQTGEIGPIAQMIAGIDIALWDLAARRDGVPLYRALGGAPRDSVPVYATGINPDQPEKFAAARYAEGHRVQAENRFRQRARPRAISGPCARRSAGRRAACDANQALSVELRSSSRAPREADRPAMVRGGDRVDAPRCGTHSQACAGSGRRRRLPGLPVRRRHRRRRAARAAA